MEVNELKWKPPLTSFLSWSLYLASKARVIAVVYHICKAHTRSHNLAIFVNVFHGALAAHPLLPCGPFCRSQCLAWKCRRYAAREYQWSRIRSEHLCVLLGIYSGFSNHSLHYQHDNPRQLKL